MSDRTTNSGIHTPKGGARSRTKNGEPAERSSTLVQPPIRTQPKVSGGPSLEKFKKQKEQKKKVDEEKKRKAEQEKKRLQEEENNRPLNRCIDKIYNDCLTGDKNVNNNKTNRDIVATYDMTMYKLSNFKKDKQDKELTDEEILKLKKQIIGELKYSTFNDRCFEAIIGIYNEANGGSEKFLKDIETVRNSNFVGEMSKRCFNNETAIQFTRTVKNNTPAVEPEHEEEQKKEEEEKKTEEEKTEEEEKKEDKKKDEHEGEEEQKGEEEDKKTEEEKTEEEEKEEDKKKDEHEGEEEQKGEEEDKKTEEEKTEEEEKEEDKKKDEHEGEEEQKEEEEKTEKEEEEQPHKFTVTSVAIRQPAKAKEQEQIQEQDPILPHLQNIAKFDRSNKNALNGTIGEVGEINTILNNMNIVDSNDRMSRILQSADVLREQNRNNPELVENFDQNLRSSITHFGNIEEAQQSNTIAELETLRIVANPESGITKENIQNIRPNQLSDEYKHTLQNGGCGVKIGNMKIVKDENGVEYYELTGLDSATGDSLDGATIRIPVMDGDKRRNAVDVVETFRRGEIGQRIENGLVQMFDKDNKPVKELSEEQKDAFKRKSIADINKLRAEKEKKKKKETKQKQTQNIPPIEIQEAVNKGLPGFSGAVATQSEEKLPTNSPPMHGQDQKKNKKVGLGGGK